MGRKKLEILGHKYGYLTVIKEVAPNDKARMFECLCDCGNSKIIAMSSLRQGVTKSCGCKKGQLTAKKLFKDLTGMRFGKYTVIRMSEKKHAIYSYLTYWICLCDCGNIRFVNGADLSSGKSNSCGCNRKKYKLKRYNVSKRLKIIGKQFGELTVIKESPERLRNEFAFICKCSCGNETLATKGQLIRGEKRSCGCLKKKSPPNLKDMIGEKFGKLTILERAGRTKNDNALWLCQCDCGNKVTTMGTTLRRGEAVSCGCDKQKQIANARNILTKDKTIDGVQIPLLTKKVRSDSKTGHKGVTKRKRRGREYYEVSIALKGNRKYIGSFKNLDDAITARKEAEIKYYEPYIKALEDKENETD